MLLTTDIIDAYKTIFSENTPKPYNIITLDISELKSAYRLRALDSHPDRAKLTGKDEDELHKEFREIDNAYKRLQTFLAYLSTCKIKNKDILNIIPQTKLLFGQFLLYTKQISLKNLLEALEWQQKQRPLIGKIATDTMLISKDDVAHIMSNRKINEKFGECAIRLGIINSIQFRNIIRKQQKLQKPIGNFFLLEKILSKDELEISLKYFKIHNRKF